MANFGFAKCTRRERLKFFQSSLPYFSSNALVPTSPRKARKWYSEEPHPTNQSFLTFKNGHYGIYFTLFNHELRKKEHDPTPFDSKSFIVIVREIPAADFVPDFSISKANQEIHNDINWLKTVARDLLSTTSLVKSKYTLKQLYHTRNFSTSALKAKDPPSAPNPPQNIENFSKEVSEEPDSYVHDILGNTEDGFEENFLQTQSAQIMKAFESQNSPDDLNVIYPLYQSLKRNNIRLPSIDEYNVVLKSIAMRSLDSDGSLSATESKLTILLTIYQDILSACKVDARCHPNTETYHTVLNTIFKSSKDLLSLTSTSELPRHTYNHYIHKASEFCQVGINLYTSLLHDAKSAAPNVWGDVLYCMNFFPGLLNKSVASSLIELKDHNSHEADFYIGLMSLVKFFHKPELLDLDNKKCYDFVRDVFDNYKRQCGTNPQLGEFANDIYSAMVKALVASNNIPIATKFVDEICISYKDTLQTAKPSQAQILAISNLMSEYLGALMDVGTVDHLEKAFNLLKTVRQVAYLPDTNVAVYNDMICKYIAQYVNQERLKTNDANAVEASRAQETIYSKIWQLYDYVAIRKDFARLNATTMPKVNSIELLLSLSIDLGDWPKVFRLIKEILLHDICINDWNVLKKLCQVLSTSASRDGNYHYDVLWSILEQQASHLCGDSAQLNDLLSEHVCFLLIDKPTTFSQIMNSRLVRDAFEKCDIQTSNFFGLTSLMSYLQTEADSRSLTTHERTKLLAYQASMINEFEDTESHYLELARELIEFKAILEKSFIKAVVDSNGQSMTAAVHQACASLGVPLKNCEPQELCAKQYQINLVPYLNMSGKKGINSFIECFKEGYNFSDETWGAIITRGFAIDILEPGIVLTIPNFVDRVIESGSSCIDNLVSLISLHNDKVNIEVFKYLLAHKHDQILGSQRISKSFADFAQQTRNQYFLRLISKEFVRLANLNQEKEWMSTVIEKLNSMGMYSTVHSIISQNLAFFNRGIDIREKADQRFLKNILVAYMKTGKEQEINDIFKYHFSGPAEKKLLASSDELLTCLLDYYSSVGSHEMVAQKFGNLANRSTSIKQSIQFSNLLLSLKGSGNATRFKHDKNANSLALTLLQENDLLKMRKLYQTNKYLVQDKEKFFNTLVNDLTKAAMMLDGQYLDKISAKFEAVIKFCKVIRLEKISAETLRNIIDFLTVTKSMNLLNILFNKFLINNTLVSSFNFYFLDIELRSQTDFHRLLEGFEIGFRKNDDLLNLAMIQDFKSREC